ncbi:hypothetical protein PQC61_gp14 [Gordonia phage Emperor]|uniref:Minor tail protein n=2 Tax=root TaxID=1 RepID=A0A2Z4Q4C8_9CAUD|nr:hypothetical protein [Gordonia westfalica]YP_010674611.1 hypothetical protein PQC61_gp14 [Gordonia phage Emperor]AWY04760.1 hypothetical protein PBI_EMPEROR_14 [Gordonia phage Emperor]SDU50396.1 hypothetical protein SAMN04488548_1341649 [Gordonia westfalica]
MADAQVRVEGARELRRSMRQAEIDLTEMKETHARVASLVAGRGRSAAPVASGRLAGTVRAGATRTAAVVRAGRKSVPYAGPIHWGWPARGITANPWLAGAAAESEPAWLALYTDAVDQIIDRIEGTHTP